MFEIAIAIHNTYFAFYNINKLHHTRVYVNEHNTSSVGTRAHDVRLNYKNVRMYTQVSVAMRVPFVIIIQLCMYVCV